MIHRESTCVPAGWPGPRRPPHAGGSSRSAKELALHTFHATLALVCVVVGLVSPGCDSTSSKPASGEPSSAGRDPRELFTSKTPNLPGPLAGLSFGMSRDAVTKAAPALAESHGNSTEFRGTWFDTYVDDHGGLKVVRVRVDAEGTNLETILTQAWGEPRRGTDLGDPILYWFNPDARIRATIRLHEGIENMVELEPYLPAAALIGEGTDKLGFETVPLLGSSYEALGVNYPQWLDQMSHDEAERHRALLEKRIDKSLDVLGDAVPTGDLILPPTEFGTLTLVRPTFTGGAIERFTVEIPWGSFPTEKAEIEAMLVKKWGAPAKEELHGSERWIYAAASPRIVVEDDASAKAWKITVSP